MWELQNLADGCALTILVRHLPPGTSKRNKIGHRLFPFISQDRRGRPLTSLAAIVNQIAGTRTKSGLQVRREFDRGRYPKGEKISKEQRTDLRIKLDEFHGDWNYKISPRPNRSKSIT